MCIWEEYYLATACPETAFLVTRTDSESAALHCVRSVRIRNFSGPYSPGVGLGMEIYRGNLRIQSKCGKIRNRKTPNMGTFYAVQC